MDTLGLIKNKVIISVQAAYGEPLYDEVCMNAMMKSVVNGGAQVLRLAGTRDVRNAKRLFDIPVIGITKPKQLPENWLETVYITPAVADVNVLAEAGADIIAFDGTGRMRKEDSLSDIINAVKKNNKIAMADVATFEDAENAKELGVDIVSTTLSGYTAETKSKSLRPDFELLERIVKELHIPAILEGRIWEVSQVKKAFELGAFAVVIGSAVTRPQLITKRFIDWR